MPGRSDCREHAGRTDDKTDRVRTAAEGFKKKTGRRPRILVSRFAPPPSDRHVKMLAAAYADLGFDADVCLDSGIPEHLAKMAMENDVHAIAVSLQVRSANINPIGSLLAALKSQGAEDIRVVFHEDASLDAVHSSAEAKEWCDPNRTKAFADAAMDLLVGIKGNGV
jgi:methylmalonyl-CoA mutase cobalamin-binding domain/chain